MTTRRGWDVVVVGGGLIGSSVAYHLANAGMRTLLIERDDLASGASGANFGLIQVQDAEFGLSLELTLQSFARFSTLEAELDYALGHRQSGYLLLIENPKQQAIIERRATQLRAAGLAVQLLDRDAVCHLEPNMAPEPIIGALYHPDEGEIIPFKLVHAYVLRGQERGLKVSTHTEVRRVKVQGGRVVGLDTGNGFVPTESVVLAAGAWTRQLVRTAGVDIPLHWLRGEALITEPLAPIVDNAMCSAGFFEETEEAAGQIVSFTLNQRPQGNVMLGEAALVTDHLGRRVSTTSLPAIACEAGRRFPDLRRTRVLRGWAIPVAYTADNRPLLGLLEEPEGLLIAAGCKSTIVLTPLVGELVAATVTGKHVDPRLAEFSPVRNPDRAGESEP